VLAALARWGHNGFHAGQQKEVSALQTNPFCESDFGRCSNPFLPVALVLLATGTGKSLIYQLPALLYQVTNTQIHRL